MNKFWSSRGIRLTTHERFHFNHRLALFLRSGVSIITALTYITEDAHRMRVRTKFSSITEQVASGIPLAEALGNHRDAFTSFDIALVRIGETSGRLHESLAYIATLIERERQLRARLVGALLYPALILAATLAIVLFLVLYAFPKLLPLFRGFDGTLPLSTRLVIGISDLLITHGLIILVAIATIAAFFMWIERRPAVRLRRHYTQLQLPMFGSMLRAYQLALIARVLGTLVKSGVGLVPALELAVAVATNTAYQEALRRAGKEVLRGKRLGDTCTKFPVLFPPLMTQVVRTGELTGNLAESLLQVADIYEEEVRERSQQLTVLMEPILMIVMGLIVGFIALSIITPIYGITQDLSF